MLIIASALSVQDVRDRPMEAQQQADQAHAKFDDEKSEFSGYLRLWKWLSDARGGKVVARSRARWRPSTRLRQAQCAQPGLLARQPACQRRAARRHGGGAAGAVQPAEQADEATHKISNRQWEQLLRQNFINIRRVREWRDIHSQLLTVVKEQKWLLNNEAAGYEAVHLSMLSGLLGNIGYRAEESESYLGAHGIKFHPHPGAHLSKKPGRWIVAAEQVETSRLYGRGIAAIEPQWLEEVGGHLLKKQLLDPHWSKKQADVVALERATLYGLVVYNGRRVSYGRVDPHEARNLFIRQALVEGEWETKWHFLPANLKLMRKVEELEHKSRRQDVLVDDELIFAFYDQHLPKDVYSGATFDKWFRAESRNQPELLRLSRDELMRHEAAGITTDKFPKTVKLGGADCSASYLHSPATRATVSRSPCRCSCSTRCLRSAPSGWCRACSRTRSRRCSRACPSARAAVLCRCPRARRGWPSCSPRASAGPRGLIDALLKQVRDETSLDVKRADFKLDMLSPHLFMNFRITDEHGRQLGQGRNLGALKAEWGAKARGAFQALASLKVAAGASDTSISESKQSENDNRQAQAAPKMIRLRGKPAQSHDARYKDWSFGELPELMEIKKGGTTLIGFPALIDHGDAVGIEVFDEPEAAAAKHRVGLRRLFALQIRDALKYLEKNIPDLQKMAVAYMPLGTQEELRGQIIDVAIDRAFCRSRCRATRPTSSSACRTAVGALR